MKTAKTEKPRFVPLEIAHKALNELAHKIGQEAQNARHDVEWCERQFWQRVADPQFWKLLPK